jgi:hypothetical protein
MLQFQIHYLKSIEELISVKIYIHSGNYLELVLIGASPSFLKTEKIASLIFDVSVPL